MTMLDPDVTALSSVEVADLVGVSYRILDNWLREGHVTLACDPTPGSGRRRSWTEDEVVALRLFVAEYRKLQEFQETFRDGRVWEKAIREAETASA
jgi:transposase